MNTTYFLGSNTPFGFLGNYDHLLQNKCIILLGGPGSGKSTILKKVLKVSDEAGLDTESYLCSSDVKSLDGVYIPSLKTSIIDGTSPHSVTATFPLTRHIVVNLLEKADLSKIALHNADIENCIKLKKQYFNDAYCDLKCMYMLKTKNINNVNHNSKSIDNIVDKIYDIVRDENCEHAVRFISAITNMGFIDKISDLNLKEITVNTDDITLLKLIEILGNKLTSYNIPHTTFISPFYNRPDAIRIGDFVVIAKSRSKNPYEIFELDRNFVQDDLEDVLFSRAIDNIKKAHDIHIEMEKYYISAQDFDDINKKTDQILFNIFKEI